MDFLKEYDYPLTEERKRHFEFTVAALSEAGHPPTSIVRTNIKLEARWDGEPVPVDTFNKARRLCGGCEFGDWLVAVTWYAENTNDDFTFLANTHVECTL